MNKEEIKEKVINTIRNKFNIEDIEINEKSNLVLDLQADSLDIIDAVMTIEDEFRLSIPDEEVEKWATIENVVGYLQERLNS